jgi:[CysO sulfur-carrier protein]-S-L-cysteine hydrolase
MIASRDGVAVAVHRARNAAASPLRYIIDPREQYEITQEIEDAGLDLGLIYHSHTRSDPVPSQTDINLAKLGGSDLPAFPGTLYLIVGVKDAAQPDLRTWRIVGDEVTQVELQVEG